MQPLKTEPTLVGKTLEEAFEILKENPKMTQIGSSKNQAFIILSRKDDIPKGFDFENSDGEIAIYLNKPQFVYNIVEGEQKEFDDERKIKFNDFKFEFDYMLNWIVVAKNEFMCSIPFGDEIIAPVLHLGVVEPR